MQDVVDRCKDIYLRGADKPKLGVFLAGMKKLES